MNKKYAFILALLITGLLASNFYLFSSSLKSKRESIIISRVIDGDTLVAEDGRLLRLLNINAPEKNFFNSKKSLEFLNSLAGKETEADFSDIDKYHRSLVRIYSPDYINLKLVELGLASKFLVNAGELEDFSTAESLAIESGLGIWNHSSYFGCFKSNINEKKEVINLRNICKDIDVNDWTIKDESRKVYKFPNLSLGEINIHSGNGIDNSTDIYWKSKTDIWNDDRDSLYLFDNKERIAHYEVYGY